MPTPLPALRKQIATGELKPVYLLAGEEHLLLLEAADALRARARELGYAEREVFDADANFDWNQLAQSASSMSLFATRKLIDLRMPTGKPGKEGSAAIIEYCENPPPDTVLLITATQWSKAHETSWVTAVEKAGVFVSLWPLKPNELPDWVAQRMASRGLKPTRDAIEALVERIEGNLLAAAQEIDKLALLQGDKPLDAATLEDLVADSARFDVFKLADAALAGDASRALRILAGLRAEGEQVVGLLGWLLNQQQLLARLANARGNQAAAFKAERIWPARETIYKKALARADRTHWDACLIQAGRVDRIGKGRGT
ncbi:DNA polymerase III subunit delta, partial [Rudaea sp.]|uniref:DNA polymerase III subunit delta n=1 Tax=Rudaea sp. TaxID=2136325 RepID=UPI002ECFF294